MQGRGIAPNVTTFNALINAFEKECQWEKALDLLQKISDCGVEPDVITDRQCYVISTYVGDGRAFNRASNLFSHSK
jgi:pentatricopeptide repeat protein